MKQFILFLSIIISQSILGFTLTDSRFFRFGEPSEIKVHVAEDGCSASGGYTAQEILDMTMNGAELYWNTVETANIRFVRGSIISGLTANGKDTSSFYASTTGQERNAVYVGCSSNISATAAAVATSRGSDKNMVGILLFKDASNNFGRDFDTTSAIFAHELGHTLGLGHSRHNLALMDSSGGALGLNKLTQDDRDGATYLYPHEKKVGGCLGSLGTIFFIDDDNPPIDPTAVATFLAGFLLGAIFLGRRGKHYGGRDGGVPCALS